MTLFIQFCLVGIISGLLYAVIAVSTVVIFRATGVINFAQGAFMVLGAYLSYIFLVSLGLPYFAAILLLAGCAIVLGLLFDAIIFTKLRELSPLALVMTTIGISLITLAILEGEFGGNVFLLPPLFPSGVSTIGSIRIANADIISGIIELAALLAIVFYLRVTRTGKEMRAVAENYEGAVATGINVRHAIRVSVVIGTLVAFFGGFILGTTTSVNPELASLGYLAFPAMVIGGVDSVGGAIVGGLVVGLAQSLLAGYINGEAADSLTYVALLVVLLAWPTGLFGSGKLREV